jgi:hypothetical protein
VPVTGNSRASGAAKPKLDCRFAANTACGTTIRLENSHQRPDVANARCSVSPDLPSAFCPLFRGPKQLYTSHAIWRPAARSASFENEAYRMREPLRRPESEFGLPNSAGPNCVEQWRGNSEPPAGMASLLFWPQGYAHMRSYRGITISILADRGYGCRPARFSAHGAGGGPPSGKDS